MKFIADSMLGGLARWLRILGQDVTYSASATDNELLLLAKEGKMILLTGDKELQRRAKARNIVSTLVQGETEEERLAEVAGSFGLNLEIEMASTNCPECGSSLKEVSKEDLSGKVPPSSLTLYEKFWSCTNNSCGKVYWIGSHWKRMRRTLADAKKLVGITT